VGTEPAGVHAEDAIARLELRHASADGLDFARELASQDPEARPAQTGVEAVGPWVGGPYRGVGAVHRRCPDADEDLPGRRQRLRDVIDPQHVRGAVAVAHDGSHRRRP
jgi:hypothetical protein